MMSEIETRLANNAIAGKKRNPYTVWFVVLAFIAPVALAYIMFFFVDVKSFVNHGEILNPIVHFSQTIQLYCFISVNTFSVTLRI